MWARSRRCIQANPKNRSRGNAVQILVPDAAQSVWVTWYGSLCTYNAAVEEVGECRVYEGGGESTRWTNFVSSLQYDAYELSQLRLGICLNSGSVHLTRVCLVSKCIYIAFTHAPTQVLFMATIANLGYQYLNCHLLEVPKCSQLPKTLARK